MAEEIGQVGEKAKDPYSRAEQELCTVCEMDLFSSAREDVCCPTVSFWSTLPSKDQ